MNYTIYDFLGNIGVLLIIGAYFMLQINRLKSTDLSYSFMNAAGAVLIIISLLFEFNYSAFIVEVFWLIISIYGIYKAVKK
ncbi:MAG: hypothetical protein JXR46_11465 [Calditrichaceae bacterium]|nr:hypothetical protein [Calditrichaceae bacterium]MBN2709653.1 hypothetical protein [Calditrichaceae bacterium]RQV92448.1 MAG: hypothetical protein EH224_15730 [Calditrichota bacterium]